MSTPNSVTRDLFRRSGPEPRRSVQLYDTQIRAESFAIFFESLHIGSSSFRDPDRYNSHSTFQVHRCFRCELFSVAIVAGRKNTPLDGSDGSIKPLRQLAETGLPT